MVATKTALSVRIDALSDGDTKSAEEAPIAGIEHRSKLEVRLRALEQGLGITSVRRQTGAAGMQNHPPRFEMRGNGGQYSTSGDALLPSQPVVGNGANGANGDVGIGRIDGVEDDFPKTNKKEKKRKREAIAEFEAEAGEVVLAAPTETPDEIDKKEKKRRKKEAKLADSANGLVRRAAAEIGDESLANSTTTTVTGDLPKGTETTIDEAERKRLKKEKRAKKAAKAA